MTIEKFFDQIETLSGQKKYIDGPRILSYRDLANHSKKLGAFLKSANLNASDRSGIASTDHLQIASRFLSALRAHLSVLILDPNAKTTELIEILRRANLKAIFADQELVHRWNIYSTAHGLCDHIWPIVKQK